jgi:hypothetical protein
MCPCIQMIMWFTWLTLALIAVASTTKPIWTGVDCVLAFVFGLTGPITAVVVGAAVVVRFAMRAKLNTLPFAVMLPCAVVQAWLSAHSGRANGHFHPQFATSAWVFATQSIVSLSPFATAVLLFAVIWTVIKRQNYVVAVILLAAAMLDGICARLADSQGFPQGGRYLVPTMIAIGLLPVLLLNGKKPVYGWIVTICALLALGHFTVAQNPIQGPKWAEYVQAYRQLPKGATLRVPLVPSPWFMTLHKS